MLDKSVICWAERGEEGEKIGDSIVKFTLNAINCMMENKFKLDGLF